MKKELLLGSALALSMIATPMTAFAADYQGPADPTDPIETTTIVTADIYATGIDVTVSDSITMEVMGGQTEATVSDLIVKNNANVGVLGIKKMSVQAKDEWTKVADTTDFAKLNMDAKKFSLVHANHDLMTDYTTLQTVDPGVSHTIQLEGQSGPVRRQMNDVEIADVILTITAQ